MKIGFDARMIDHPGIGRYIRCLVPELVKLAPEDEFILFGDTGKMEIFDAHSNVRLVQWKAPIYSPQEQFSVPYDDEEIDLVHVPHFNIPVFCQKKMVVTIHDLIYLFFPKSVSSPLARWYARFMIGKSLDKAERVIAVSDNTKDDLVRIFGNRYASKISTVYEAADESFREIEDKGLIDKVRDKYGLSENVILYVGSIKPHKNVGSVIEAFERLKNWGVPHQLVIVGRWDSKEDRLKRAIEANEDIIYIGEVPPSYLVALYNIASVLVHLSLYEGFGLTVLEAMKCGTAVVVSDTSSLPEVAGEAALTVSPLNVGQIADTVYNVLINKSLRDGMTAAGRDHAGEFSWTKAAEETLKVYGKH